MFEKEINSKISILVDESTISNNKKTKQKRAIIIYVIACVGNSEEPLTFFLDIVELPATTADVIHTALLDNLFHYGFTEDILRERLVCCACDGASVMLGSKSDQSAQPVSRHSHLALYEPPTGVERGGCCRGGCRRSQSISVFL